MIKSIRNFFSDKIGPKFNSLGFRISKVINHNNRHYTLKNNHRCGIEDQLLSNSFVNIPKLPNPKFDSKADLLIAEAAVPKIIENNDHQQLFLQSVKSSFALSEKQRLNNNDVFQQLNRLTELLQSISSEYSINGSYNTSFLREIIHNICLDLNVMLATLDSKLYSYTEKD